VEVVQKRHSSGFRSEFNAESTTLLSSKPAIPQAVKATRYPAACALHGKEQGCLGLVLCWQYAWHLIVGLDEGEVALVAGQEQMSYDCLNQRDNQLARRLISARFSPGK
jgi:hypothetical protein